MGWVWRSTLINLTSYEASDGYYKADALSPALNKVYGERIERK